MNTQLRTRFCFKNANDINFPLQSNFVPLFGELIIVTENSNFPCFKIGDGVTELQYLPIMTAKQINDVNVDQLILKEDFVQNFLTSEFSFTLKADSWSKTKPHIQIIQVPELVEGTKIRLIQNINNISIRQQEKQEWNYIDYTKIKNGLVEFYCLNNYPTIDIKGIGQYYKNFLTEV